MSLQVARDHIYSLVACSPRGFRTCLHDIPNLVRLIDVFHVEYQRVPVALAWRIRTSYIA